MIGLSSTNQCLSVECSDIDVTGSQACEEVTPGELPLSLPQQAEDNTLPRPPEPTLAKTPPSASNLPHTQYDVTNKKDKGISKLIPFHFNDPPGICVCPYINYMYNIMSSIMYTAKQCYDIIMTCFTHRKLSAVNGEICLQ